MTHVEPRAPYPGAPSDQTKQGGLKDQNARPLPEDDSAEADIETAGSLMRDDSRATRKRGPESPGVRQSPHNMAVERCELVPAESRGQPDPTPGPRAGLDRQSTPGVGEGTRHLCITVKQPKVSTRVEQRQMFRLAVNIDQ